MVTDKEEAESAFIEFQDIIDFLKQVLFVHGKLAFQVYVIGVVVASQAHGNCSWYSCSHAFRDGRLDHFDASNPSFMGVSDSFKTRMRIERSPLLSNLA